MIWTMRLLLVILAACSGQDVDYLDTLDYLFDMSSLSTDELRELIQCFNDRGPCNELSASFKEYSSWIVQEACRRCTSSQKHTIHVLMERVREELPDEFQFFLDKYDPDGSLYEAFYESYKDF